MQVVGLPQVFDILLRDQARLLPALLQLAELREGMIERLVGVDQLLELLDDALLDLEVRLLFGLEVGNELVPAPAVLLEELLELDLRTVDRRGEILFGAPLGDEMAVCGLHLGTADAVEGDLQRLDVAAQRLHGLLLEHAGEQGHQFLLSLAGELVLGRIGSLLRELPGSLLLGRLALDFQSGVAGSQGGVLIGEVDLDIGRRRFVVLDGNRLDRRADARPPGPRRSLLLRIRSGLGCCGGLNGPGVFSSRRRLGNPSRGFGRALRRRFGRSRRRSGVSGRLGVLRIGGRFGFGDFGNLDRSCLCILSHGADVLLGSRKCRFFSSHHSTRF